MPKSQNGNEELKDMRGHGAFSKQCRYIKAENVPRVVVGSEAGDPRERQMVIPCLENTVIGFVVLKSKSCHCVEAHLRRVDWKE